MDDLDLKRIDRRLHISRMKGFFLNVITGLFIAIMVLVVSDIFYALSLGEFTDNPTNYGNIEKISLGDKVFILLIFFIIFVASIRFYIRVVSYMNMSFLNLFFSYVAFIPNILAFSIIKFDMMLIEVDILKFIPNIYWLIPISIIFVLIKVIQVRLYLKYVKKRVSSNTIIKDKMKKGVNYFNRILLGVSLMLLLSLIIMYLITFVSAKSIQDALGSIGKYIFFSALIFMIIYYFAMYFKRGFKDKEMRDLILEINDELGYNE